MENLIKKELGMTDYLFRLTNSRIEDIYFIARPMNEHSDRVICFNEVVWVEADGNYSHIHLIGGHYVSVTINIGQVEALLKVSPDGAFIRISRSTIISLRWLYRRDVNLLYLVSSSTPFTVGKTYREGFNKRISSFRMLKDDK